MDFPRKRALSPLPPAPACKIARPTLHDNSSGDPGSSLAHAATTPPTSTATFETPAAPLATLPWLAATRCISTACVAPTVLPECAVDYTPAAAFTDQHDQMAMCDSQPERTVCFENPVLSQRVVCKKATNE